MITYLSVIEAFERQARATPRRIAITCGDDAWRFEALNSAANRLARWLLAQGLQPADRVIILIDDGPLRLLSTLAVMKLGGVFVQLNPADPDALLAGLIEQVEPAAALASAAHGARLRELVPATCPVAEPGAQPAYPDDDLHRYPTADTLAYIQYTSGSTGEPKGVMVSHGSLSFVATTCIASNALTADDQVGLFSPLWFSHIWAALSIGAGLHFHDLARDGIAGVADWIERRGITVWSTFPTAFRHVVDALDPGRRLTTVRVVSLTGESASTADVARCRQHFRADGTFINCYASTELVYISNTYVQWADPAGAPILTIGEPVAGVSVVLVDAAHRPVADGSTGELAIRSRYLAAGYWRNPSLTAARFLPVAGSDERLFLTGDVGRKDPSGHIVLTGRKDELIKVRGFRVLPNEVELALMAHPQVRSAGVTAFANARGDRRLAAYYCADTALETHGLIAHMAARVPPHMVPSLLVRLDRLPLTGSGKVARRRLPVPGAVERDGLPAFEPPASELEERLLSLWQSLLGLTGIGIDDDFFALGGDSLQAARLSVEVTDLFALEVAPDLLLTQIGTIRSMAVAIRTARREPGRAAHPPGARHGAPSPAPNPSAPDPSGPDTPAPDTSAADTCVERATGLRRFRAGRRIGAMQISSLGFRSPELTRIGRPDGVRIAFLGDSLSLEASHVCNEDAWPHRVVATLRDACPTQSFDYVNAALPALHTRGMLSMYAHHVAPLEPDVVVLQTADAIADSAGMARAQGVFGGNHHRASRLAGRHALWHKIEMNLLILARLAVLHRSAGKAVLDVGRLAGTFEARLRQLAERCSEQAAVLVMVTICSRLRRGQALWEQIRGAETVVYYAPFLHIDSLLDLHAAYNAVIRRVALQFDAVLIDVNDLVPTGRPYFADSMHLRPAGARLLAEGLAAGLLGHERFQALAGQRATPVPAARAAVSTDLRT